MRNVIGVPHLFVLLAIATSSVPALTPPAAAQTTQSTTAPASPGKLLDQVLFKVDFDVEPVERVLNELARRLRINIAVDWNEVGFEYDKPVKLALHAVTGRTVLKLALDDLAEPDHPADFVIRDGRVLISSVRKLAGPISVREYDLTPLLAGDAPPLRNVRPDDIAAVVQGATCRGTWGKLAEAGSLLVQGATLNIKQTERGHAEIQRLLDTLREPKPCDSLEGRQSRETDAALRKPLPEFKVDSVPCEQALSWFAELSGLNVVVQWLALADAGIERDVPLTVSAKDVTFERALEMLLAKITTKKTHADYDIVGGVITVGTPASLEHRLSWRVYDLASAVGKGRDRRAEIVTRMQRDVLPRSWKSKGGSGQLWLIGDRLVVLQSCRGHLAVERVLAQLGA